MATTTVGSQVTYDLIATITSTGGPLTFSSITQTYHSLVLHGAPNFSSAPASADITLNGDTGFTSYFVSTYNATSYMGVNQYFNTVSAPYMSTGFANTLGNGFVMYLLDYTDTATYQSTLSAGSSANGISRGQGSWKTVGAVSSVTINSPFHTTGTTYNLYGLKKV
jgi:hypothetical protein